MRNGSFELDDDDTVVPFSHHLILGKLHLVDLAGGERVDVSKPKGEDLLKAQFINKSLLALGEVIQSLASRTSIAKKTRLSVGGGDSGMNTPQSPSTPLVSPSPRSMSELHVPYLNNKLTHFLKDALGGAARTVLVACVGPEGENYSVNLHCIQYALKASKIVNLVSNVCVNIPSSLECDPSSEISLIK